MELKNVTRYYPEEMPHGETVQYFCSEDGLDFYDAMDKFTKKYKLCIHPETGAIHSVAEDVSRLYPAGFSVVEADTLPEGSSPENFDISGRWKFDCGRIVDTLTRESALARKTAEITAWRNQQENAEITFELNGRRWDAGHAPRNRLAPVLDAARAGVLPESFYWTDADNNDIALTTEELEALDAGMVQAMVQQGFRIHEQQRRMKQAIDALTTPDDILAFVVSW
ncbi:DUF4376 domain-containing protein [Escherichia coli]